MSLFLFSLLVRVLFALLAPYKYQSFGDTEEYLETAKRICSLGAYPFAHIALPTFRAPGFPFFLAIVSACESLPLWWTKVSLILIDSLSCVIGMGIVSILSSRNNSTRGILFGVAYTLYPLFIQQSVAIQRETLTVFAILE